MASPSPVGVAYHLLHRAHECRHRAQSVLLFRTPSDGCQRDDTVVHDDSDLRIGGRGTRENYRIHLEQINVGDARTRTLEMHVRRKGREVRHLECAMLGYVVGRKRALSSEICQVQSSQDYKLVSNEKWRGLIAPTVQYDNLVGCVNIKALSKRESSRVIIEGCVRRRVVGCNGSMCKACDQFLYVSDTLHAGNGRTKSGVIPEIQIKARQRSQ